MSTGLLYGYQFKDGSVSVDEKKSKAVILIHQRLLEGVSLTALTDILTHSPYESPGGNKKWCRAAVRKIAGNKGYCGTEIYPKILNEAVVEKVQQLLLIANQKNGNSSRVRLEKKPELQAYIHCGECGKPIKVKLNLDKVITFYCSCGVKASEEEMIKTCSQLIRALRINPSLLNSAIDKPEEVTSFEVNKLDVEIKKKMRTSHYSNEDLIRVLQKRASEQYKLLTINDEEIMTRMIQKLIDLKEDDDFEIEFMRRIVNRIYLTDKEKVVYELKNKQYFDLELR